MNEIFKDFIHLLSCAINDITPDKSRVNMMDMEKLYQLAKFHSVSAAIYISLSKIGVENKEFHQAYKKAIRKNILLDMESMSIFSDFESTEIWYMPLKGSVLKEMYPETGMREMADNDVLYDSEKQQMVKEIMLSHGYTVESVGKTHHDVYMKPPVLNFEFHTVLFSSEHIHSLYNYYSDPKSLLCKDDNNSYGYHLSDEDFYVYITAHEWKHFCKGGTGIRSLLDCYVYYKVKGDTLDWNYISEECKKLEMDDFEKKRRELAIKVFSNQKLPELTTDETDLLMYYLKAGTYGTIENIVTKELKNQSKLSFLIHNVFVSRKYMERSVPFTAKSPLLYPIGFIWRCCRVLIKRRDMLKQMIKTVWKYKG